MLHNSRERCVACNVHRSCRFNEERAEFTTSGAFYERADVRYQPEVDYMTIRTYGDSRTPRPPEIAMDLSPSTRVAGRPAVILDDTLDTGVTADFAANHLLGRGASSIDLVVLAQKRRERTTWQDATLCGFETPDVWLTGWGLDDARLGKEANRWLADLAVANGPSDVVDSAVQ